MIEAIEIHVVKLKNPILTGVYLGIGFMLAPFVLLLFILIVLAALT